MEHYCNDNERREENKIEENKSIIRESGIKSKLRVKN
jgi:hypothetical protein